MAPREVRTPPRLRTSTHRRAAAKSTAADFLHLQPPVFFISESLQPGRAAIVPSLPLLIMAAAFFCFSIGVVSTPAFAASPGAAGDLYVGGFSSNNVVQFDGQTGALVGEFIPAGSGGLYNVSGITFGPNGNLFVCNKWSSVDADSAAIMKFDGTTGAFIGTVIAGEDGANPASGWLHSPTRLMFTPDGRLLVCGQSNSAVLAYDATTFEWLGTFAIGGPSPGGLDGPSGIALGPDGATYVTGAEFGEPDNTGHIVKYHSTTGQLQSVLATGLDSSVLEMQFDSGGKCWILSFWGDTETRSTGKLLQLDPVLGSVVTTADVVKPRGLVPAPWGNILVAHQGEVLEYDGTTGQLVGQFATGLLSNAEGMAFKPIPPTAMPAPSVTGVSAANLDACDDTVSVTVSGANLNTTETTVMLKGSGEPGITGLVTGGNAGALEVEFKLGAKIAGGMRDVVVVNPDGQTSTLASAIDLAPCYSGRDTNLLVLGNRHRFKTRDGLFEFDNETGNLIGFVVEDETTDGDDLRISSGLAFGYDGDLLLSSPIPAGSGSVYRYDPITGQKLGTFIPVGAGGMLEPDRLRFGPNGNLFVLHKNAICSMSGVLEFDGQSGAFVRDFVPLGSCSLGCVDDMEFSADGDLYVTDPEGGVIRFDGQTGQCTAAPFVASPSDPRARFGPLEFSPGLGDLVLPWWSATGSGLGRVEIYDSNSGGFLATAIPAPAGDIQQANASCFGPNGNLFVSGYPDLIHQYDLEAGAVMGVFAKQGIPSSAGSLTFEIAFQPMTGDTNADWVLDLKDFASLQRCIGGDGIAPGDHRCLVLDHDRDGDVDSIDGAALVERVTGPN